MNPSDARHAVAVCAGVTVPLCECEWATGEPGGLTCTKSGWFISSFEHEGTWVRVAASASVDPASVTSQLLGPTLDPRTHVACCGYARADGWRRHGALVQSSLLSAVPPRLPATGDHDLPCSTRPLACSHRHTDSSLPATTSPRHRRPADTRTAETA